MIECLVAHRRAMTLTEIAIALGISKSNVHQLLATLSQRRLVERLPNQTYRIGMKAWEIGSRAAPLEIGRIGTPHMAELVRKISEGVDIGMLDGVQTVCITLIECPQPVRVHARVGDRNLAHSTSTGLALLAELSDDDVIARLPERLEKVAPDTIGDRDSLLKELRRIRMNGYALNLGGWRSDVTGLAVPMRDPDGRSIAGLCVPAPRYRVTRQWLDLVLPALKATAQRIEQDLAGGIEAAPLDAPRRKSAAGSKR